MNFCRTARAAFSTLHVAGHRCHAASLEDSQGGWLWWAWAEVELVQSQRLMERLLSCQSLWQQGLGTRTAGFRGLHGLPCNVVVLLVGDCFSCYIPRVECRHAHTCARMLRSPNPWLLVSITACNHGSLNP